MHIHPDDLILFAVSLFTFMAIAVSFKFSKSVFAIQLSIFSAYSAYFYYSLFMKSIDGTALAWWFYALLITSVHLLGMIVFLTVKFWKR
ncbi:hypothetical protein BH09BAC1_BH09BAC1_21740 [soil metagenome]